MASSSDTQRPSHLLISLAMLMLLLCGSVVADTTPPVSNDLETKGQRLAERYRQAHATQDLGALRALVHWQDASPRTREIIEQRLKLYLELSINQIEFRPLSGTERFDRFGSSPNLVPVGWLALFFEPPPQDSRLYAKAFVVGRHSSGEFRITVAQPAH